MSNPSSTPSSSPTPAATGNSNAQPPVVIVRLWPKIPVLYPMAIVALICGIIMMKEGVSHQTQQVCGTVFLAFFAFAMFSITVDIGLTWALLWIAGILISGLVMFIINIYHPFLGALGDWVKTFQPVANSTFYFTIFGVWVFLMLLGLILVRFHYVRIESNEAIVVGGVLDKRRRYSMMRVTYTKEVKDVFEYYLPFVRAGRLVLRFPNEEEPLVLDNVMNIDKVIKEVEQLTSVMQVSPSQSD